MDSFMRRKKMFNKMRTEEIYKEEDGMEIVNFEVMESFY
jgi:hypothetical protein